LLSITTKYQIYSCMLYGFLIPTNLHCVDTKLTPQTPNQRYYREKCRDFSKTHQIELT